MAWLDWDAARETFGEWLQRTRPTSGERFGFGAVPSDRTRPTPPTASLGTAEQQSARALIRTVLGQFGLDALADRLWQQYFAGAPLEQVFLDLRTTPEYKARFPAMDVLAKKGRAITEAQYIGYEQQAVELYRRFGLPSGFYDQPADFATLIGGEVSIAELADRVQLASAASMTAPPEVRAKLQRFGLGAGDLVAYWLDPDKALPLLQQQFAAATIGAASARTGFGLLTADEAERLAQLGVTQQEAVQGFAALAASTELFGALPGTAETAIGREQQLAGTFEGSADARQQIERRARGRRAVFEQGGGLAQTSRGVAGLGSAEV